MTAESLKSKLGDDKRVVTRHVIDNIMFIGLNRVPKRNAFDIELRTELSLAYAEMENDPDVRAGILFAHGAHFTGGLDMGPVASQTMREGDRGLPPNGLDFRQLEGATRTTPLVSAVQGWCLTLGIELLLATDIRIASETVRFSQMEVSRGIFPFGGSTIRFPREVGWGNAMRWILTGDTFNAAEAYRIGVVQEIVPEDTELDRAFEIAKVITKQAPLGVSAAIRSARTAERDGEREAADQLLPEIISLLNSEDGTEGVQSFKERRQAKFTGR